MNGIVLTRTIREERPSVKVLILTAYEDEAHLKQALAAGASGFVVKRSATTTLIPAIRAAMAGATFVDPMVAERLKGALASTTIGADELSPREREVLRQTAFGHCHQGNCRADGHREQVGRDLPGPRQREVGTQVASRNCSLRPRRGLVGIALPTVAETFTTCFPVRNFPDTRASPQERLIVYPLFDREVGKPACRATSGKTTT